MQTGGKKKVEKLRLIQGISNSKRKSVYRGIILKSQEELVNVCKCQSFQ